MVFIFCVFIAASMIISIDIVGKGLKLCNSAVVTLEPDQGIMDIISWIERIERCTRPSKVLLGKGGPITKCYGPEANFVMP